MIYGQASTQKAAIRYLEEAPVQSVTALATVLGLHRSSVSRALNELRRRGMVEKVGRNWMITGTGLEAALPMTRKERADLMRLALLAIRDAPQHAYNIANSTLLLLEVWDRSSHAD